MFLFVLIFALTFGPLPEAQATVPSASVMFASPGPAWKPALANLFSFSGAGSAKFTEHEPYLVVHSKHFPQFNGMTTRELPRILDALGLVLAAAQVSPQQVGPMTAGSLAQAIQKGQRSMTEALDAEDHPAVLRQAVSVLERILPLYERVNEKNVSLFGRDFAPPEAQTIHALKNSYRQARERLSAHEAEQVDDTADHIHQELEQQGGPGA